MALLFAFHDQAAGACVGAEYSEGTFAKGHGAVVRVSPLAPDIIPEGVSVHRGRTGVVPAFNAAE